jgi:hypothetical protein
MSDLQDIIATNSIRAYNQGFDQGGREERARIVELLTEIRNTWQKPAVFNYPKELDNLIAVIAEENE